MRHVVEIERLSDNLLADLESREVALWIARFPPENMLESVVKLLQLPWNLIACETYSGEVMSTLAAADGIHNVLTRKRGFVQIIDADPSRIQLPDRCLPVYLLNGRGQPEQPSAFEAQLRRLTMIESIRRSAPRDIIVLSDDGDPIPQDLKSLWSSGFRTRLTVVSSATGGRDQLEAWLSKSEGVATAGILRASAKEVIEDIVARYYSTYPEQRHIIRIRDAQGTLRKIDVTDVDDPERSVLDSYSLIEERDLAVLSPRELSEEEFVAFFRDATSSWRPYEAGLPWMRDDNSKQTLLKLLSKLDSDGPEADCIAYIKSESGAGGTTYARTLAWECARLGYPALVAKQFPFVPDALPVANFLIRAQAASEPRPDTTKEAPPQKDASSRRYEAPWLIVFDSLHWQYRDNELVRFRNELEKFGRPACLLVVTGPYLTLESVASPVSKNLAELNHAIGIDEARELGRHLNEFLRTYGKPREAWQWDRFYEDHAIRYVEGVAAFWVALSFWIQGQYDLSESIQEWMYKSFKANVKDRAMKDALLSIAAFSSERLPLPDALLPPSPNQWPISQLLADSRPKLAALGLIRILSDKGKYWSLAHDILGRLLINAVFYDHKEREELGLSNARDSDHLRFLLLRNLSRSTKLGETAYRGVGEEFATSIFKIDPDHGHGAFLPIWREVLSALDEMPNSLRDTSRLFRHHCAVSRRRIAKLDEKYFGVTKADRLELLNRAVGDIKYALEFIEFTPGSESNLNLYNSLANAYFDLAEAEAAVGATRERLAQLRSLANEATRNAYAESPTNSFVIETYVKNLLQEARTYSERPAEQCVEALGILFSAMASNQTLYRATRLGTLADQAVRILLETSPDSDELSEPENALGVLIKAWKTLAAGRQGSEMDLSNLSEQTRAAALRILSHPAGRGNMQVIRLSYDLTCFARPLDFRDQLDLVEQLSTNDYALTPQLRLEYAILLYQNSRPLEGVKVFKYLRHLWRESEHFVQVPERLRWLRSPDGTLQIVKANVGSEHAIHPFAKVDEFGSVLVPLRPEEFGFRGLTPGQRFSCHVNFGHNGPFLRPLTTGPREIVAG